MRYVVLILMLFMDLSVPLEGAAWAQAVSKPQGILIRTIGIEGFVLGDKAQFEKLFKPYRNKNLTVTDMDDILHKVQGIYELNGYLQLVAIAYHVDKHRLVYTVSMIS